MAERRCWFPDCDRPGTVAVVIEDRAEYTGPVSKVEPTCGQFACPDHARAETAHDHWEGADGYHVEAWRESWPAEVYGGM